MRALDDLQTMCTNVVATVYPPLSPLDFSDPPLRSSSLQFLIIVEQRCTTASYSTFYELGHFRLKAISLIEWTIGRVQTCWKLDARSRLLGAFSKNAAIPSVEERTRALESRVAFILPLSTISK